MTTMKQFLTLKRDQARGLPISAVAIKLGRDRKTVRKCFRMDKDEFTRYLERMSERGKEFEAYREEILGIYCDHEGRIVYSAAVYDYLHERHSTLPGSERTLRNYLAWLKADLRNWVGRANARISQATRLMPLADFEAHEKPALRPLRASIFRPGAASAGREPRKVDPKSLVSVGGSRYSVPSSHRDGEVLVERRDGMVRAFDPESGLEIAAHAESASPGAVVTDPRHYLCSVI